MKIPVVLQLFSFIFPNSVVHVLLYYHSSISLLILHFQSPMSRLNLISYDFSAISMLFAQKHAGYNHLLILFFHCHIPPFKNDGVDRGGYISNIPSNNSSLRCYMFDVQALAYRPLPSQEA